MTIRIKGPETSQTNKNLIKFAKITQKIGI